MNKRITLLIALLVIITIPTGQAKAQERALRVVYHQIAHLSPADEEMILKMNNPAIMEQVQAQLKNHEGDFILYSHSGLYGYASDKALTDEAFTIDEQGYYINLKTGEQISPMLIIDRFFLVRDSLNKINWKIGSETSTIAGKTCYKATYTREDNSVTEAWFCPEVPYSLGPLGSTGLPGLIFKIKHPSVTLTLKSLDFDTKLLPIKLPKGKIMSKEEYEKIKAKKEKQSRADQKSGQGVKIIQF